MNFNICIKLAELRTKIKNSPQPQVRNLSCQSPQVRNFVRKSAIADLRTCELTCGLAQLWSCTSREYLGWEYCAMPPDVGPRHKAKSAKYTLKSHNQILIKHACGRGLRYLAF